METRWGEGTVRRQIGANVLRAAVASSAWRGGVCRRGSEGQLSKVQGRHAHRAACGKAEQEKWEGVCFFSSLAPGRDAAEARKENKT